MERHIIEFLLMLFALKISPAATSGTACEKASCYGVEGAFACERFPADAGLCRACTSTCDAAAIELHGGRIVSDNNNPVQELMALGFSRAQVLPDVDDAYHYFGSITPAVPCQSAVLGASRTDFDA